MELVYTERLKEARIKKGYTYQQMANSLGYNSRTTYRYIELGKTKPKLDVMIKVSELLDQPIEYFFKLK